MFMMGPTKQPPHREMPQLPPGPSIGFHGSQHLPRPGGGQSRIVPKESNSGLDPSQSASSLPSLHDLDLRSDKALATRPLSQPANESSLLPAQFYQYVPLPSNQHTPAQASPKHFGVLRSHPESLPLLKPDGHKKRTEEAKSLKSRPRTSRALPKEKTDILKDWLLNHMTWPYPTEEDKQNFIRVTGLTMLQITNWFNNARRRQLPAWQDAQKQGNALSRGQKNKRRQEFAQSSSLSPQSSSSSSSMEDVEETDPITG